jgi:hypothetical protein
MPGEYIAHAVFVSAWKHRTTNFLNVLNDIKSENFEIWSKTGKIRDIARVLV